jgi:hypothetical protein
LHGVKDAEGASHAHLSLIYFLLYADPVVVEMQARIAALQEKGEQARDISSAVISRRRHEAAMTSGVHQGKRKATVSMTGSTGARARASVSRGPRSGARGRAKAVASSASGTTSESMAESSGVNTFAMDTGQGSAAPGPSRLGA